MINRRNGTKAVNEVLKGLSYGQKSTINSYLNFGYSAFVRKSYNHEPIAVIVSPDEQTVAVVDDDGDLSMDHEIKLRH